MEQRATSVLGHPSGALVPSPPNSSGLNESLASGVSWAAVAAGAFVAAALAVILLALGSGLGLSSISPWANSGASASALGAATIIWLIAMQAIASGMGGYIAGRLRTKWVNVHTDEVFFRDTAHGFLVWAVALVLSASLLASAATSILGSAVQAGATGLSMGAAAAVRSGGRSADTDTNAYYVDSLFRSDSAQAAGSDAATTPEIERIFGRGLGPTALSDGDRAYLAKKVAARTGLSTTEAQKRVDDTIAQARLAEAEARRAADVARKAAAHSLLWIFLSLLIGAFCASYAATLGGRQRDGVIT